MQLAVEDFNAAKYKIDGEVAQATLLIADDQADPRSGAQIAQKMVESDVKCVFGNYNSSVALAASRIYQQAGIPQLSGATSPDFTRQNFKTTFRILTSDIQQGGVLARFAVKNLGAKEIAIIDDRTAYGQGVADEFDRAVKNAGGKIVRREFTSDKAQDFRAILLSLKRLKPQAIFYGGMAPQAIFLAKQMQALQMHALLLGAEPLKIGSYLKVAGHAGNGTVVALGGKPLNKMPGGLAFKRRYEKRFGVPMDVLAPYIYDGMTAMFSAMRKADSVEPEKYLPYLTEIEIPGVTTNKFAYTESGDLRDGTVTIYKAVSGSWRVLDTVSQINNRYVQDDGPVYKLARYY
jgi:branched-chain amino acid transport system substrate-binding protein